MDTKDLQENILKDIEFITTKLNKIRENNKDKSLDIKLMADYHRYAETRLFLLQSLNTHLPMVGD